MEETIQRLFKEGKNNLFFIEQATSADKNMKPKVYWSDKKKIVFAMVYFGWLIARGQYTRSNYED